MPVISSKSPNEIVPVKFSYSSVVSSIDSASITVTVREGTDATPNAMKEGTPIIDGSTVIQYIKGGITGNTYNIICLADASVAAYELNAIMTIKDSE